MTDKTCHIKTLSWKSVETTWMYGSCLYFTQRNAWGLILFRKKSQNMTEPMY